MTHPSPALPAAGTDSLAPVVLVADDDAASRRFLHDALQGLGARVIGCSDGPQALQAATVERFDLLLLDCRMPGAGARDVLAALRDDPTTASSRSPAVATTAELDPALGAQLLAEGFADLLLKPCRIEDLKRVLGFSPAIMDRLPLLDDSAALLASGDPATMTALRQLLQQELLVLCNELDQLGADPQGLRERLHRLRSSCGFCGATTLAEHAASLQQSLAQHAGSTGPGIERFRHALVDTLRALDRPRPAG
ncbi:MAG: response regulator [Xanthomonadaceae bacterium]|nr:response regulator [Xanthomonadaceae bacterium]